MSASSPREVADRQCGQRSEKHQYVSDSHSDRSASDLRFLMMGDVPSKLFQDVLLQHRIRTCITHTWCKFGSRMSKERVGCHSVVGLSL